MMYPFADNTLVITPNKHLAQTLLSTPFAPQDMPVRAQAHCLPFQTFLKQAYTQLIEHSPHDAHPVLLNPQQASVLWQHTAQRDLNHSLPPTLIQSAFTTWQQTQHWQVPLTSPLFGLTTQTQLFQAWSLAFEEALTAHHAITDAQLLPYLLRFPLLCAHQEVIFTCFDDFTPVQYQLQDALRAQGIVVTLHDLPARPDAVATCYTASDPLTERQALLHWIRYHLAQHQTVGVVVPHLEQHGPVLKRWLQAQCPQATLALSLGSPLACYPLIEQALSALHACTWPTQSLTPSQWGALLTQRLIELPFPGPSPLTSEAYQTVERFLELIETFASLSMVTPALSAAQALHTLTQLAQQTLFQPQQAANASIHLLGLFEAAGVTYPALWIMGATDQQFPAAHVPSPFIPLPLQKTYHLPHSDPVHEWKLALLRFQRFQHATPDLVVSYPTTTEAMINRPSPLLQKLPPYIPPSATCVPALLPLEWITAPDAIPLFSQEKQTYGSHLLAEQVKCPFRAFAQYRLHAKPPEPEAEPYSLKARGILLHQALEALWRSLKTQQKLLRLSEEALSVYLSNALQQATSSLQEFQQLPLPLQILEKKRLSQLITASLAWEKTREPFTVVALESAHHVALGPLTFHIRLDRRDQTAQAHWIIDYKTSLPSPLPWYQKPPLAPQILLYALIAPEIQGLFFHALKHGQSTVKGIDAQRDAHWERLRAEWKQTLTQLAIDFHAGACTTTPQQPTLCQSCEFQQLCRHWSNA